MPAHLACSRCDGPVSSAEIGEGLVVRVDGELVCALCIDTLPPNIQGGIARARRSRGLSPILRYLEHPRQPGFRIYAFSDSADLAQHRRSILRGLPPVTIHLRAPAREMTWKPWLALGAVTLGLSGVIVFLVQAPVDGRTTPALPQPFTTPPAPPAPPVPVAEPVAVPTTATIVETPPPPTLPPQVLDPIPPPLTTPIIQVPAPVVIPAPPPIQPPLPPETPPQPAAPAPPPEPPTPTSGPSAPTPTHAEEEEPSSAVPDLDRLALHLERLITGGKPAQPITPRSNDRPPLPWPQIPGATVALVAAQEDPGPGPWRGRRTLRIALPEDSGISGVTLALHGGRADRKELEVFILEGGKTNRLGTVPVAPRWMSIGIAAPPGSTVVVSETANRITTPFWYAGGVIVQGAIPAAGLLPLDTPALQLGDDRRLRELVDAATKERRIKPDPLRFQVMLEGPQGETAPIKAWQAPFRKELLPLFEKRPPNGLVLFGDLFPTQGDPRWPDEDRGQILFFGLEDEDGALPKGTLLNRLNALRSRLLSREGPGGGVIAIPILGQVLATTPPSAEWIGVRDALTRRGEPWIDLRGVPPTDTARVLGHAVANVIFHLQWLQNRPK